MPATGDNGRAPTHTREVRRALAAERDYLYLRDHVAQLEEDLAGHRADMDACLWKAAKYWRLARLRAT